MYTILLVFGVIFLLMVKEPSPRVSIFCHPSRIKWNLLKLYCSLCSYYLFITFQVQIVAITNHPVGDSRPSNTLVVTCPVQPEPPLIVNQPSYKKGVVVIAWDAPKPSIVEAPGHPANITYYTVYVDGVWHGEVKANQSSDSHG